MSKQWVVGKVTSPLGTPFVTYLRHPRRYGVEVWDEEHDAQLFTVLGSVLASSEALGLVADAR